MDELNFESMCQMLIASAKKGYSRETLMSTLIHPIDWNLTEIYKVSLESSIFARKPTELPLYNFFQRVNGNFPANPNNEELIKKYDVIYVSEGDEVVSDIFKCETDSFSHDFACNLIHNKFFCLIGNRGRGKTMLTNRFFTKYTKALENDHCLTWFRIDANKIYDMQDRVLQINGSLVENYFIAHVAYVLFRYSSFKTKNSPDHPYSELFKKVYVSIIQDNDQDFADVYPIFLKLERRYNELKNNMNQNNNFISESIVKSIVFSGNDFKFEDAKLVLEIFFDKFRKKGVRVSCVIDGIDNIAWSKANENYKLMCTEVSAFIKTFDNIYSGHSNICLVTRPETMTELDILISRPGYHANEMGVGSTIKFHEQIIGENNINTIISTKDTAALDSDLFDNERRRAILDSFDDNSEVSSLIEFSEKIEHIFRSFSENYLRKLSEILNIRLSSNQMPIIDQTEASNWPEQISSNDVYKYLFNSNTRALIDARLNSLQSEKIFENLGRVKSDDVTRLLQYTFLNGKVYKYSQPIAGKNRHEKISRGDVLPNVFWYDVKKSQSPYEWEGLAGLRIIQSLVHFDSLTGGEIASILIKYFKYSPFVLADFFESYVAFGLLEIDYIKGKKSVTETASKIEEDYNVFFKVTDKAHLLFQLSIFDPEFIYYICLDTPMYRRVVGKNNGVNHHVGFDLRGNAQGLFTDCQIVNCHTFLRNSYLCNLKEMDFIKSIDVSKTDFLDKAHFELIYNLDDQLQIVMEHVFTEALKKCIEADRAMQFMNLDEFTVSLKEFCKMA